MTSIRFYNRGKALNIDISNRCPLECPRCQRQVWFRNHNRKVYGGDISMEDIKKLAAHYKWFDFCGQLSDPVHHPKFVEILKYLYDNKINVSVHNASSAKSKSWYIKAFKAHPEAKWIFGIDGLPEESCMYRINQDGEKLFNIMLESKNHLNNTPYWQFIIFSYNEKSLDKAKKMAADNGLMFITTQSSRWNSKDDPYRPSEKYKLGHTREHIK
jgi:MoaA/NifB/PqqE/SkfB family radical SAM enzyme